MKMRTQILLAQIPTVIIICTLTFFFISFLGSIQEKSEVILVNNFKSIVAMQNINKHLEDLNDIFTRPEQSNPETSSKIKSLEVLIEEQMLIQDKNIKDSTERDLTKILHEKWQTYKEMLRNGVLNPQNADHNTYKEIKRLTEDVMGLNKDELIRTKDNLSTLISNFLLYITFGSILSLTFGFYMSWFFTGLFLSPLNKMTEMMREMGKEDKTTLLHIKGSEEIENLCDEFNLMTSRLEEYHKGSLGKLRQDYQTLKAAFDALPDPIFLLDPITNFIYINKHARSLFGISNELQRTPSLFHVEGLWKDILIKASNHVVETKSSYTPQKEEDRITLLKENKKIFFLPRAYPITKGTGKEYRKVEGVAIILQNLMRQPLSEINTAETYETLVHEFQSPLMDIHMAIHLCLQEDGDPLTEKQEEVLHDAREKCDHLEKLCQDLLNLSRSGHKKNKYQPEDVDLNKIILKLMTSFKLEAEEKGVFISFKEPPYLSKIKASNDQLNTLVINLIHNAIHYASPETTVTITLQEKNDNVELEVNNKGPLIPQKYREDIFKKHFKAPNQSKERAGLGLYIALQITESYGGKIGVRSTAKQGTTFWVKFPMIQDK